MPPRLLKTPSQKTSLDEWSATTVVALGGNTARAPSKFAIGDGFDTHLALKQDHPADSLVFDSPQLGDSALALFEVLTLNKQLCGAQKRADLLRPEGREKLQSRRHYVVEGELRMGLRTSGSRYISAEQERRQ